MMSSAGQKIDAWRPRLGSLYTFLNAAPASPKEYSIRSCSGRYSGISSVRRKFMSSRTRSAASSLSLSASPIISVLTGPAAGNVSMIVSDWNRMAASVSTVLYTPQAPAHGSVRSSYFIPRTSRPLTYIFTQSSREVMSASTSSSISEAMACRSFSSMCSARFASKAMGASSSGTSPTSPSSTISMAPSTPATACGSMNMRVSSSTLSSPIGAGLIAFSMVVLYGISSTRPCAASLAARPAGRIVCV